MNTPTPSAEPFEIGIVALPGWTSVDLLESMDGTALEEAVESLVGERQELASRRQDMLDVVRAAAAGANATGVVYARAMANTDDPELPLVATLTVAVAPAPPDEFLAQLADDSDEARVSTVDLPTGPATRVEQFELVQLFGSDAGLLLAIVQYLVPLPAENLFALLTFVTPNSVVADLMVGLFDDIASSVELIPAAGQNTI